jgi:hypothetical protein
VVVGSPGITNDPDVVPGRRTTRRCRWFFRTEAYQPAHETYPVRARGPVHGIIGSHCMSPGVPDRSTMALASLIAALGLTPYLYRA